MSYDREKLATVLRQGAWMEVEKRRLESLRLAKDECDVSRWR